MANLRNAFDKYFEIVPATTPDLLDHCYHLRYQVLSLEKQIPDFDALKYPDGREHDEYDAHAVHCLLRHRASGEFAGHVRLVLADREDPRRRFPLELHCEHQFEPQRFDPKRLPRSHTAEISRLVLARRFRSRRGESGTVYGKISSRNVTREERREFPHPFLGLLLAIMQMTVEHQITHWYAGMEPGLNRQLSRLGVQLDAIGPLVKYHGLRRPYLGVVDDVMASAYYRHRDVWELLTQDGRLWPAPRSRATGLIDP